MLELDNVSKSYSGARGPVRVLSGASLRVSPGEFVAIHGPSGCGKTTLLLILGGLLAPDSGVVRLDGEDPYALSGEVRAKWRAEHVGFAFQQFHLIPYLSVEDNILAPILASHEIPDARARVERMLAQFRLTDRRSHVPAALSTGERQRTAMARALLSNPSCLLVDEPTGNLDAENAEIVTTALTDFREKNGIVVMVTHDAAATARASRTLFLRDGKIQEPAQAAA